MNPNYYKKQQERAWSRKLELISMMGGECSKCGYHKNMAALEFHHVNPNEKDFQLDARHLSNTNMERIKKEAEKCILLCSNCHREVHNPEQNIEVIQSMSFSNKSLKFPKKKQSICENCGREFDAVKGKRFCSSKCRDESKGYPSKAEVTEKYNELKSQQKVAEYFGLTRKVIIGILKREE